MCRDFANLGKEQVQVLLKPWCQAQGLPCLSEFKGEFDRFTQDGQLVYLWTYPKSPRMNAVCERFKRTVPESIQEQLVDFHEDLLFTDLELFNEKPVDWLVKYNGVCPCKGLGLQASVK